MHDFIELGQSKINGDEIKLALKATFSTLIPLPKNVIILTLMSKLAQNEIFFKSIYFCQWFLLLKWECRKFILPISNLNGHKFAMLTPCVANDKRKWVNVIARKKIPSRCGNVGYYFPKLCEVSSWRGHILWMPMCHLLIYLVKSLNAW